uniref:Uncharacterized protein n=1 Tax=Panagrolaimus sp. JU765 TaxID=591449 RepID=A0AC34R0U6_9BILA
MKFPEVSKCLKNFCCSHKKALIIFGAVLSAVFIFLVIFFFLFPSDKKSTMPQNHEPVTTPMPEMNTTTTPFEISTTSPTVSTMQIIQVLAEEIDTEFTETRNKITWICQEIQKMFPEAIFKEHGANERADICAETEATINIYILADCTALQMEEKQCDEHKRSLAIKCQYRIDSANEESQIIEEIEFIKNDIESQLFN